MKHPLYTAVLLCAALSCPSLQADYEDGVEAAAAGDYATALKEFTVAAEAGLDLAQYNLAILYFTGQGVAQDYAEALRWTKAAAEQGHLNAQFNLGALHYTGTGTAVDMAQAFAWYEQAAEGQHAGPSTTWPPCMNSEKEWKWIWCARTSGPVLRSTTNLPMHRRFWKDWPPP
jgi:TPR repeat protein